MEGNDYNNGYERQLDGANLFGGIDGGEFPDYMIEKDSSIITYIVYILIAVIVIIILYYLYKMIFANSESYADMDPTIYQNRGGQGTTNSNNVPTSPQTNIEMTTNTPTESILNVDFDGIVPPANNLN